MFVIRLKSCDNVLWDGGKRIGEREEEKEGERGEEGGRWGESAVRWECFFRGM